MFLIFYIKSRLQMHWLYIFLTFCNKSLSLKVACLFKVLFISWVTLFISIEVERSCYTAKQNVDRRLLHGMKWKKLPCQKCRWTGRFRNRVIIILHSSNLLTVRSISRNLILAVTSRTSLCTTRNLKLVYRIRIDFPCAHKYSEFQ